MKYTYSILIIFALIGCSNTKIITDNSSLNRNDKTIQYILKKYKVEETNKNILYFTSGFKNEKLKITIENDILCNSEINTIDQLSLAYVQVITNDKPIILKFNKITLSLNYENLKKYKFVYIIKMMNKNRYLIEYSNQSKNFM
ncbi:hypothetical protein B0A58_16005 [Flavobacterium branchiophilum NBRC 15030 = ATCC 35035]|uniref:Lipoprotein n=1 Tax=Flavobacterium branchiophilum TaxID=55197 RepID=A0A543FZM0_9FLAO|nr:hypothetical protein [Flavobacterium branchiophilum]OXA66243.1 hypothetical protein B0A58_16005 [Flavobacterium branchiophilum NBRC 15030 = ATCC 35035]TQM39280.1 hypothetical protein BC670_0056 [Flavobacterium branchiophilum]GEM56757.1 hypothetical protein FB1_29780 [Flavobacterium branchiophilum NBRC 15030 = ATCC 35035]